MSSLPPTSAFVDAEKAAPVAEGSGERSLLVREKGSWRVGDPLPGQDLEAAENAKPGDPAGVLSYAVEFVLQREDGEEVWAGEVRGPRIQLGLRTSPTARTADGSIAATRMFGLVGGRLIHGTWPAGGWCRAGGALAGAGLLTYLPQFFTAPAVRISHGVILGAGLLLLALTRPATPSSRPLQQTAAAGRVDQPSGRPLRRA